MIRYNILDDHYEKENMENKLEQNIKFKNPETNVDITFSITKNINYIYGSNGSGKTTLSRQIANMSNNSHVFNSDFISKNIYITSSLGAKIDSQNKDNFTKLFISEESVCQIKDIEHLKTNQQAVQVFQSRSFDVFKNIKPSSNDFVNDYMNKVIKELIIKDTYEFYDEVEEDLKNIHISNILTTSIDSDSTWDEKKAQFDEGTILNNLTEKIAKTKTLNDIFNENVYLIRLNERIQNYNDSIQKVEDMEKIFNKVKREKIETYHNWVKDGLDLHENQEDCLFCEKKNILQNKEKWKKIINERVLKDKNELIKLINTDINEIKNIILSDENMYSTIIPKTFQTALKIKIGLEELISKIKNNELLTKFIIEIEMDHILKDRESLFKELVNFQLNKKLEFYISPFFYLNNINLKIEEKNKELNNTLGTITEQTIKQINKYGNLFGLSKDVNLAIDKRGKNSKISLSIKNPKNDISTLSEGQKHKLALSVFFAKIEASKIKADYIVLDDPMLSLDVNSYHALKKIIIEELSEKCIKLLVLTHNFNFLVFMLSNVFDSEKNQKCIDLFELNRVGCSLILMKNFYLDDVRLFQSTFSECKNIDDISLWYWMILKIMRIILDLKLRFKGIDSWANPGKEIKILFKGENLVKVQDINKKITAVCKSKNSKIEDIFMAVDKLNCFCEITGFDPIINCGDLEKIKDLFKNITELKVKQNPTAKNLLFKILKSGHIIMFAGKSSDSEKAYIMHTRYQITNSLTSFSTQKDID